MGLIDIASSKSVWRGIEYYQQGKVTSWQLNEDGTSEGTVSGSNNESYQVHVDLVHPKRSTCNCPLANGKQIICKHIIAVSLCMDPSEADRFKNDKTRYSSLEEEIYAKKYTKYMSFAKNMSKEELREAYVELMIELDKIRVTTSKEKYDKPF